MPLRVPPPPDASGGSFGFGVRVIVNGAWGFASSPVVTPEEIAAITKEAVIIAKANASIQSRPIELAPVKAYRIAAYVISGALAALGGQGGTGARARVPDS